MALSNSATENSLCIKFLSDFDSPWLLFLRPSREKNLCFKRLIWVGQEKVGWSPCLTFSSVQLLSHVRLFATPWTAPCQASLSITNSQSLLKLMSIELVMPSSHLILCRPLLLPPSIFPSIKSQFFASGGQRIGISVSASVLPMNIQDWFPLEWIGWISLLFKGLSRVFSNTLVQKHQFFSAQLSSQSSSHIHTWPLEKP